MREADEPNEIVQVLASASAQEEEEIAAAAGVLRSWGYELRVVGPLERTFRQRLTAAGVRATQTPVAAGTSLAAQWSDVRALAAQLRELRPALIHAYGLRAAWGGVLARGSLPHRPPVVCSPHLLPHLLFENGRSSIRRWACRRLLRRCDAVVVATETQREQLSRLDHSAARDADLVPYSISRHQPTDSLDLGRRRRILGVSPSSAVVGCVVDDLDMAALELFLDAGRELCRDYPSLEFALIGTGVDRPQYHALAHERGLLGATIFLDPHGRFIRALSVLNVLVTPQRGWPAGMLALQALTQQVGVVAFADSEVAEMLAGNAGVTLAAADGAAALGEGIITQLQSAAEALPATAEELAAPSGSPFLVSREFYDLNQPWGRPASRPEQPAGAPATPADALSAFAATQAARALIAVYQRLLDEG
ncbi:MAG: glycosyltransferase [Armatimonadota bacterium]